MSADDWGTRAAPTVLLVADSAVDAADASAAIAAAAARQVATIDLMAGAAGFDRQPGADIVMIEMAGADAESLAAILAAVAGHVSGGRQAIVSFAAAQLDEVAAALLGLHVQLLCDPSPADRAAALAVALAASGRQRLREDGPRSEAARLARLHEEIARIADLLARIGRDPAPAAGFADRTTAFRGEPDDTPIAAAEIRRAIRARRLRDQFFGGGFFEDPAWDILLDLFAADLELVRVSVSSLCIAAAVAPTTALRWIGRMTEAGLLERQPDPGDRRRAFLALSPGARASMRGYWRAMRKLGALPG